MSVNLTVLKQAGLSTESEVVAIGQVELEAVFDWVDKIEEMGGVMAIQDDDIELKRLDIVCRGVNPQHFTAPEGKELRRFVVRDPASMNHWELQFGGDVAELAQLIDKIAVHEMHHEYHDQVSA